MTHEQTPSTPNFDSSLQKEISLGAEIAMLRRNPAIGAEDLFSSSKMLTSEHPDKLGVRVALNTPIETAANGRSGVEQNLMAVIGLGKNVALGVVEGKDESGGKVSYLSLLSSNPYGDEGRASFIDVLTEGAAITIGRSKVEQVVGREGSVPGVSRSHCTIELKDGILAVIDENSTNGTTVFRNTTGSRTNQFGSIESWSQPSDKTKKLIEAAEEARRISKATHLGRFTVNNG